MPRNRPLPAAAMLACALLLAACSRQTAPAAATTTAATSSEAAAREPNRLELRLDGRPWHADRAIEAIVGAAGFDGMLMLSGSFGPKDRDEQTFNLNLTGVRGPGTYHVRGSGVVDAVQLANLSAERYLVGGALGADVDVVVRTLQRDPLRVEATFSGTLVASDGQRLRLEDGHFSYRQ